MEQAKTNSVAQAVAIAAVPDLIADALKATRKGDAGALFEKPIIELLRKVREANPAKWARIRQEAKETRIVSLAALDCVTAPEKAVGGGMFDDVEPWPDVVNGLELLNDIYELAKRFIIADMETLIAASLWIVMTWMMDAVGTSPIANITAPEKRCGKTVLLTFIGKLVYRKMQVSNIAPAALFRSIEAWSPTLLIDEVDSFLRENEEARGILNAGLTRDSAYVVRCVGDDHTPTRFSVWGAKALCGIGKLADTLADRSIPLRLRRKTPGETVENMRHVDQAVWDTLSAKIARWTDDHREKIRASRPVPIDGLNDRANDCWEPLLSIAEAAGADWATYARCAAKALHGIEEDAPSVNTELLGDIRDVFAAKSVTRISSVDLLAALVADDEGPWATWNHGKPMTPRQLSKRLEEFRIRPATMRYGDDRFKGYALKSFEDNFARYLSAPNP
jgi:hypothetical protein